jgi:hypothetical protein
MTTLSEIINAADKINLPRIRSASIETYADWLVAESATEYMTTWIVHFDAYESYVKLDNILKKIDLSPGVLKNNGTSPCP